MATAKTNRYRMMIECEEAWHVVFPWHPLPGDFREVVMRLKAKGAATDHVYYGIVRARIQQVEEGKMRTGSEAKLDLVERIVMNRLRPEREVRA